VISQAGRAVQALADSAFLQVRAIEKALPGRRVTYVIGSDPLRRA